MDNGKVTGQAHGNAGAHRGQFAEAFEGALRVASEQGFDQSPGGVLSPLQDHQSGPGPFHIGATQADFQRRPVVGGTAFQLAIEDRQSLFQAGDVFPDQSGFEARFQQGQGGFCHCGPEGKPGRVKVGRDGITLGPGSLVGLGKTAPEIGFPGEVQAPVEIIGADFVEP